MQAKKQLNQFKRIQKHYQMELDTLTAELRKLNLQMSQRKGEFDLVEAELQDAQRPHEGSVSIVHCVAGAAHIKQVSDRWNARSQELSQATIEFETQRSRVQQQLTKIESMDRLIEQKSKLVDLEMLKREIAIADERYLQQAGNDVVKINHE